jgi:hypothetical protein
MISGLPILPTPMALQTIVLSPRLQPVSSVQGRCYGIWRGRAYNSFLEGLGYQRIVWKGSEWFLVYGGCRSDRFFFAFFGWKWLVASFDPSPPQSRGLPRSAMGGMHNCSIGVLFADPAPFPFSDLSTAARRGGGGRVGLHSFRCFRIIHTYPRRSKSFQSHTHTHTHGPRYVGM